MLNNLKIYYVHNYLVKIYYEGSINNNSNRGRIFITI